MPLKDDLILRTLEQLAGVVRALRGLSKPQDLAEAETTLKEAYRQHTGSEAALVRQLPSEQLLGVLSSAGVLDREKAYLIATLFEVDASLQQARGHEAPVGLQLKALDLHLEAALAELDVDDHHEKITALRDELTDFVLPEVSEWRLFEYERFRDEYAEAEDRLFALLERLGPTPAVAQHGERFYSALRKTSDAKLNAGGLPRAEVEEGEAAFRVQLGT